MKKTSARPRARKQASPPANRHTTGPLSLEYLLEALLEDGLIDAEQASILRVQVGQKSALHPLVRVAEHGWTSHSQPAQLLDIDRLTRWLASRTGIEYMRLDPLKIDLQKMTSYVSQTYASRLCILPVMATKDELVVATTEPFVVSWEQELEQISRLRIRRVLINPKDMERYLVEFYGVSRSLYGAMDKPRDQDSMRALQNFEQLLEVGKVGTPDADNRHVVSIVDWLLQFAFEQRASDIHLEPRRDKGAVRFRIDGILHQVHEFPAVVFSAVVSRLKSLGRMDVTDRRRPQDGRIKTVSPVGKEVEMRLSTMPTTFGEVLVLRIFDPEILVKGIAKLGFTRAELEKFQRMLDQPNGIILVTGPTGSGKTTTLYSALARLARPEINVCTIEDPIEMVEPRFNQMQVQSSIGVDFASGVRTLLRQDPDVVMIGEIRDYETAAVSIQAAMTGHLVLSTLHTNDTVSAIARLLDIGVQAFLINAGLRGVIAQRLVRLLCPHCKREEELSNEDWQSFLYPHKLRNPGRHFVAVGCDECRHTGYLGRVGIYELLEMGKKLRELVRTRADLDTLHRVAMQTGMQMMKLSGARRVVSGETTLAEVLGVLPEEDRG